MPSTKKRCKFKTEHQECRRIAVITRWCVGFRGSIYPLYYCLDHGSLDMIQRMTHPSEEEALVTSVTRKLT